MLFINKFTLFLRNLRVPPNMICRMNNIADYYPKNCIVSVPTSMLVKMNNLIDYYGVKLINAQIIDKNGIIL